jgi:hypothetical protein
MLDVVIGLVMVFAVSSLLASAIQEGLASLRNYRGKNLKQAIASMGGDDSEVVDELYKEPLLKSLFISRADKPSALSADGPSYLSADAFSTALFSLLAKSASVPMRQGTPGEFLSSITMPAGSPTGFASLLETLRTLATGVEQDWPAFEIRVQAWYEQTGERSIGWFKRRTQWDLFVIGLVIAMVMNVDSIHIGSALWNDPALREKTVQLARELSASHTTAVAAGATAGTEPGPSETPAHAATTTNPAAAAQTATDEQFKKLKAGLEELGKQKGLLGSTGGKQLGGASRLTSSLADERRMRALPKHDPRDLAQVEKQNDDNLRLLIEGFSGDALAKLPQPDLRALRNLRESAETASAFLRTERNSSRIASAPTDEAKPSADKEKPETCGGLGEAARKECSALCSKLTGNEATICRNTAFLHSLTNAGIPVGWYDGQIDRLFVPGKEQQQEPNWGAMATMAFGWLITAVAVTLGAPFWFDLLGKLVKLRGSGGKAEPGKSAGEAGAPQSITLSPTTPPRSATDEPFNDALNDDEKKLSTREIQSLQKVLNMRNDQITGRIDAQTRNAISTWQLEQKIDGTGVLTATQISTLLYSGAPGGNPTAGSADPNLTVYEG